MKKFPLLNSRIIIMPLVVTPRVIAVLDYPRDIEDFIEYAKTIRQSMTSSSHFGSLSAQLSALNTDIGKLVTTHTGTHSKPQTHFASDRNVELLKVQNDLRGLRLEVQKIADNNPDHAKAIVESAGMKVKKERTINKQDFIALRGELSGTAKLVAKGRRDRHAHEWAVSLDGTNWTHIPSTLAATTIAEGLIKGSIVDFRHRYILKDGPTEWLYFNDLVIA